MKQCETCLFKEHKDYLLGCIVNELCNSLNDLSNEIPHKRKKIYECGNYIADTEQREEKDDAEIH